MAPSVIENQGLLKCCSCISYQQQRARAEQYTWPLSRPSCNSTCQCRHCHPSPPSPAMDNPTSSSISGGENLLAAPSEASCRSLKNTMDSGDYLDYVLDVNLPRISHSSCQRSPRITEGSHSLVSDAEAAMSYCDCNGKENCVMNYTRMLSSCMSSNKDRFSCPNQNDLKFYQLLCKNDGSQKGASESPIASVEQSCTKSNGARPNCCDTTSMSFLASHQLHLNRLPHVRHFTNQDLHISHNGSDKADRNDEDSLCHKRNQDLHLHSGDANKISSGSLKLNSKLNLKSHSALNLCEKSPSRTNVSNLGENAARLTLIPNSKTVASSNEKHMSGENVANEKVYMNHLRRKKGDENKPLSRPMRTSAAVPRKASPCRRLPQAMAWNLLQILQWIALIFSVEALAVQGQGIGPRYRTHRRMCVSDNECNRAIGEVCWWAWDGCDTGECMCDPRRSFHDRSMHFCRPLKFGNEACESGDKCWEGMSCMGGQCKCKSGRMTQDRMFCQKGNQRLLGQTCSIFSDVCYQRAVHGYTRKESQCGIDGLCRCSKGYKTDGKACRKWKVNEPGCSEDHHCEGGALCIDNICQCPSAYMVVAGNSKCAKIGARYDLHQGEICNEDDEEGYCASGLICRRCPSETSNKCVRFVEAEALPYHFAGSNRKTVNAIYIILASLTAVVYICTFCFR